MNLGEFLKALSKLRLFDINLPKSISNIKILSGSGNNFSIVRVENHNLNVTINSENPSPKDIKLLKLITKHLTTGDEVLEEGDVTEGIEQLTTSSDPILFYFRGKLNPYERELLQSSVLLRKHFESGDMDSVNRLKSEILMRYGSHGSRISNLCTSNYFENSIIPMLKELESEKPLDIYHFNTIYRDITDNFPIAVFINRSMKEEEVRSSIKKRMETNIKHGIDYLYIHGIGEHNIKIIDKVLSEIEQSDRWVIKSKKVIQQKSALSIKLEFSESSKLN